MTQKSSNNVTANSGTVNESSSLMVGNGSDGNTDGVGDISEGSTNSSVGTEVDELNKPWPATYERSIMILALPTMSANVMEMATKSPKITPGFSRRARMNNLGRGYSTPDPPNALVGGRDFKKGLKKFQSLDFVKKKGADVDDSQVLEHERRALEAKAYRQKLLKKSAVVSQERYRDEEMSPGYQREKMTDDFKKQEKTEKEKSSSNSSFSQCVFNMANVLMGMGMLGLPFISKKSGWIGGIFVLFTFGAVTYYTSLLIGRTLNGDPRPAEIFDDNPFKSATVPGSSEPARMRQPLKTFPDIARASFGPWGNIFLSFTLYFELFACLCVFLVVMGDHMYALFPQISKENHTIMMAAASTIPTALLRTPRLLSYLSAVGTTASVTVVITICCLCVKVGDISETVAEAQHMDVNPPYHMLWDPSGLPLALGLVAYAFSGHALVPSIYSSMKKPKEFDKMIGFTYIIVVISSLLVLISGYYMFGATVLDQVTVSLENASLGAAGSTSTFLLTWLIILSSFSKYTLSMFPLALGIEEIVAPCIPSDGIMAIVSSAIKIILTFMSLMTALYVPSFSFICSLVGLICTLTVSVVFPAAAHLKLFGPGLSIWQKVVDWIFIIFGTVLAVLGTIATV